MSNYTQEAFDEMFTKRKKELSLEALKRYTTEGEDEYEGRVEDRLLRETPSNFPPGFDGE
ncbi:MAG: hypothetical protein PF549_04460 [Patescibacteria group bacterium]|jgi:hypothetical protein|nr:hypothetical protein [Patescibacteria group bacterium]